MECMQVTVLFCPTISVHLYKVVKAEMYYFWRNHEVIIRRSFDVFN